MNIKNNKGMVMLIVSYAIVVVLLVLSIAFSSRSLSEHRFAQAQKDYSQAIAIAEAGLGRAYYNLQQDFINSASPSWRDGSIYFEGSQVSWGPNYNDFEIFIPTTQFGDGEYEVSLKNVTGKDGDIWVRSTARVRNTEKTLQTYIRAMDINIWNNAIFAGTGASGMSINGNVDIRGSVHILGDTLSETQNAINLSGSAKIGNNYDAASAELLSRIPACPTISILESGIPRVVEYLDASVRIKNGLAALSGTGTLGEADSLGDFYKESLEGVYISDGYGGNQGAGNVYSDNGTEYSYDLGESVTFPRLTTGAYGTYANYLAYLRANALVISDPAQLAELANIQPESNFTYTDWSGKGSISMDGAGNMTIDGIVFIDYAPDGSGSNLGLDYSPSKLNAINYAGTGSIVATGNATINVNLYTSGSDSFPANVLGIMTPNQITLGVNSQIDVMGAFYAENKIFCNKQTEVAGTFVSNYFDMGSQVPSIYQVPALKDNLPPGMISSEPIWIIFTVVWQEL